MGSFLVVCVMACFYFIPTIIAYKRYHKNGAAIAMTNLFFGWCMLGWVVALIWSLTDNVYPKPFKENKDKKVLNIQTTNDTLTVKEAFELAKQLKRESKLN